MHVFLCILPIAMRLQIVFYEKTALQTTTQTPAARRNPQVAVGGESPSSSLAYTVKLGECVRIYTHTHTLPIVYRL